MPKIKEISHERELNFTNRHGHNHDGINSTLVNLTHGSIKIGDLSPEVLALFSGAPTASVGNPNFSNTPDSIFETGVIGPGSSYTGSVLWVSSALIRYTRIILSTDTEVTLTFFHKDTYNDIDREFRVERATTNFLWEGPWIHWDETATNSLHFKVTNTGLNSAMVKFVLKAGTMIANTVDSSSSVAGVSGLNALQGNVIIQGSNGIDVTTDNANRIINVGLQASVSNPTRYALSPQNPAAFNTSAAGGITNGLLLSTGKIGYLNVDPNTFVTFGSGRQWIELDLGVNQLIGKILVVPYYADYRIWNDNKIEVSSDRVTWTTLRDANPVWAVESGIEVIITNGIMCRYIRYYQNGSTVSTNNHIAKFVAYYLTNQA